MVVAYAEYLLEAGYNPSEHMFGSCIDIDPVAADRRLFSFPAGYSCGGGHGQYAHDASNRVRYTPVYYINNFGNGWTTSAGSVPCVNFFAG